MDRPVNELVHDVFVKELARFSAIRHRTSAWILLYSRYRPRSQVHCSIEHQWICQEPANGLRNDHENSDLDLKALAVIPLLNSCTLKTAK
jgi:hypothetical protein